MLRRLSELQSGEVGVVEEIVCEDASGLRKFLMLGIIPGKRVRVLQRFPSFIIRCGQTRVAVDRGLADALLVDSPQGGKK